MKSTGPPVAFERGIATLVSDGVALAIEAERNSDLELQNALARASIVSSVLFLEASANCCIDLLALGGKFAGEIDRLPTIAKFDVFLHVRFRGRAIDRSRTEYQGYVELKTLRDSFVHPRAQKYEWLEWSENSSVSTSPKSKALGLTKIPSYCYPADAVVALRAAHSFARYFFKECAGLRPSQVSALFHSEAIVPDLTDTILPSWPTNIRVWLGSHGIDLGYMRLHWHAG